MAVAPEALHPPTPPPTHTRLHLHTPPLHPPTEWWEAEVAVAPEAASLQFVVSYYEHFDNAGGADYKASKP